jgi:hypothetical protein
MAKIKEEEVLESWSLLMGGEAVNTKGKKIFRGTMRKIEAVKTPKVQFFEKEIVPSFIRKLRGDKRVFLVAENTYLKDFVMYVGALPYGEQLFVSWYLTAELRGIRKFLAKLPTFVLVLLLPITFPLMIYTRLRRKSVRPADLDMFDLEELTAYVTTVHHALKDTLEEIAKEVDFDFTKVDHKSRGFLNIT